MQLEARRGGSPGRRGLWRKTQYDRIILDMIRITATIPEELVAGADALAGRLDRSRSWIISDALRSYVGVTVSGEVETAPETPRGLGESRLAQLSADLRLTPEARVKVAELTLREARERPGAGHRLVLFDSFDDYLEWKRLEAVT